MTNNHIKFVHSHDAQLNQGVTMCVLFPSLTIRFLLDILSNVDDILKWINLDRRCHGY
jgi:hypothetical protein